MAIWNALSPDRFSAEEIEACKFAEDHGVTGFNVNLTNRRVYKGFAVYDNLVKFAELVADMPPRPKPAPLPEPEPVRARAFGFADYAEHYVRLAALYYVHGDQLPVTIASQMLLLSLTLIEELMPHSQLLADNVRQGFFPGAPDVVRKYAVDRQPENVEAALRAHAAAYTHKLRRLYNFAPPEPDPNEGEIREGAYANTLRQ